MEQEQSNIHHSERFRAGRHTEGLVHSNPPLRPHGVADETTPRNPDQNPEDLQTGEIRGPVPVDFFAGAASTLGELTGGDPNSPAATGSGTNSISSGTSAPVGSDE